MYASIRSAGISGITGTVIHVEVHTSSGFPGFTVVGMPDTVMRESKDRIRAAMISSGLSWPQSRVTINFAPASIRKSGTGTELAVLIGLLCASHELDSNRFTDAGVIGEVGLDGSIHKVSGTFTRVIALKNSGVTDIFVPAANAAEAMLIDGVTIYPLENVRGLIKCLTECEPWPDVKKYSETNNEGQGQILGDYAEVSGQTMGCEAMMLLAAGGHHTLLMGSPGIGKTMLAERLPSILPDLEDNESYEATAIESVIKGSVRSLKRKRPFRQPHHSASPIAMIGGGSNTAIPGEVTHAHQGVLFLDELSEFTHTTLDMIRQPLESGYVSLARAQFKTELPARFTLLACTNPCPCAKPRDKCTCNDVVRQRYAKKLSGPLLDRFDIRLELYSSQYNLESSFSSGDMKEKILIARDRQRLRNSRCQYGYLNAYLKTSQLKQYTPLTEKVLDLFRAKINARDISSRGAVAIWRLARTFADLDDHDEITTSHMMRAFDFRQEIS